MRDHIDDLLAAQVKLRRLSGPGRALTAVRAPIGHEIVAEAERRPGVRGPSGNVVPFPIGARPPRDPEPRTG